MRHLPILASTLAAALLLTACGTRGPLTLPPVKTALADHTSSPAEARL